MLRLVLLALALLSPLATVSAQTTFGGLTIHTPFLVEVRFGQPVLVLVSATATSNSDAILSWYGPMSVAVRLREVAILDSRSCIAGTNFMLHERALDVSAPYAWVPGIQPGFGVYQPQYSSQFPPGAHAGMGEALPYFCSELDPGNQIYRGPCGTICDYSTPQAFAAVFDVQLW